MKIALFANMDGNIGIINKFYDLLPEVSIGLSVGNMPIVSKTTPLEKFFKDDFIHEGQRAQKYLSEQQRFAKYTYAMFGEYDDPFIPAGDLDVGNLAPLGHYFILDMIAYSSQVIQDVNIPVTKKVKIGFLSGYYSRDLWGDINFSRTNQIRERKSLALCESDLQPFRGHKLDYLVTFEAPHQYDGGIKFHGGTEKITELIRETRPILHFHAHMRNPSMGYIGDTLSIGIPAMTNGFYVLNLYTAKAGLIQSTPDRPIIVSDILENTKKTI